MSPHAHALRALVVDDDPDDSELLERAARRGGYTTLSVRDGMSALAAATWFDPDVVLLDWLLPDISGAEVCRRLVPRAATGLPRPSVVLVTARSDDLDVEIGFAAGADAYVTKPVRTRRILASMADALQRNGSR